MMSSEKTCVLYQSVGSHGSSLWIAFCNICLENTFKCENEMEILITEVSTKCSTIGEAYG